MPEGFIRLEGRGREKQFSGKSIRPKHKHRRASNPGLALHPLSLLLLLAFFLSLFLFPHSHPPITISLIPASLVQCYFCVSSFFFETPSQPQILFFCLSFCCFCCCRVSEAEQSLITGKRTLKRKQDTSGGCGGVCGGVGFSHSAPKTLFSTCSTERDVGTGAQVLQRAQ